MWSLSVTDWTVWLLGYLAYNPTPPVTISSTVLAVLYYILQRLNPVAALEPEA